MNIGIIGAGNMGGALGKIWADRGHTIRFSYARDPEKLSALAQEAGHGATATTPAEAAAFADVVFLGVPWLQLEDAIQQAGSLAGKVVISCVSPLRPDFTGQTTGIAAPQPISAAEQIAQLVPDAKVVEAFNTTFAEILAAPDRQFGTETPSLFYVGDDPDANAVAAQLIAECGYDALYAGPLVNARSLETLASIWVQLAVVGGLFPNTALKVIRR